MDKISTASDWELRQYSPHLHREWDAFVAQARNATFLHSRPYMDYHADLYEDASLIAYHRGRMRALLPAARVGDTLSSHAGLSYGGWLLPPHKVDGGDMLELFEHLTAYARAIGYKQITYTPVPWIYDRVPSQEDRYALWRSGFTQQSVTLSSVIDMREPWKFDMSKRQQVRKAEARGLRIERSTDWMGFWAILQECLHSRHDASPVHTLEQIELLASRFPHAIRLYTASDEEGLQAGVVIYHTGKVAKAQYTATTPKARSMSYLPALYHRLLTQECRDCCYFDFGTSNEQGGHVLATSLLSQKFSMGATGMVCDRYSLDL